MLRRWREYIEELMNEENERERRVGRWKPWNRKLQRLVKEDEKWKGSWSR